MRVAGLVRASGAHLGAVIDADGERLTPRRRPGPRADQHRGAAGVRRARVATTCSATPSPCRSTSPSARRQIAESHTASRSCRPSCRAPALMAAANDPAVGFAADGEGGYILPGFLPAFDGAAALLKMLDLLARQRPLAQRGRRRAAQGAPGPRDGRHAVGAEGHGHALADGDGRRATSSSSTASRSLTPTAGCWPCPTRRSRSPTSGPRRRPTARPASWPRSTPAGSASSCAERRPVARMRRRFRDLATAR